MPRVAKSAQVIDPDRGIPGSPGEEFWDRYNRRHEFSLSTVAAVFFHVAIGALLVVILARLMDKPGDHAAVPVKIIEVDFGTDDGGQGSVKSGQNPDPLKAPAADPFQHGKALLPTPEKLPTVGDVDLKIDFNDPAVGLPPARPSTADFARQDKSLEEMQRAGGQKGNGPGDGKGADGSKGSGPGGTGADSSRARSLRWVLRFQTADGGDYLQQLAAMGATILVPLPPGNKNCLYFEDLRDLTKRRMVTDDDMKRLVDQIKFSDTRPASVAGVCSALGVREPARSFWAFFPRTLEDELARKETNYRNRRAEDIEETIFRVVVRGEKYEVVVHEQRANR
ncbi:MAG TPA: hypothetical protein VH092_22790 [Urbifossiella sp.]|nr:hypothetical protein [Urbifossiella sp.]